MAEVRVLWTFQIDGALTLDLTENQQPADDKTPQNIDCGHFALGFKQLGFCLSSFFLKTETLIYK